MSTQRQFDELTTQFIAGHTFPMGTPRLEECLELISAGFRAERPAVAYWAIGEAYRITGCRAYAAHYLGVARFFAKGDDALLERVSQSLEKLEEVKPHWQNLRRLWRALRAVVGFDSDDMETAPEMA